MGAFWRVCWRPIPPSLRTSSTPANPCLRILEQRIRRSARKLAAHLPASRRCSGVEPRRKLRPDRFSLLPRLLFPHQLEQLFDRVLPHALPGAQWVISEFAIPRNPLAACLARGIIGLLYRAFGLLTGLPVRALAGIRNPLLRRGLVLSHDRRYLAGLLCSQIWIPLPAPAQK